MPFKHLIGQLKPCSLIRSEDLVLQSHPDILTYAMKFEFQTSNLVPRLERLDQSYKKILSMI